MSARLQISRGDLDVLVTGDGDLLIAHNGWHDQAVAMSVGDLEWLSEIIPGLLTAMRESDA